MGLLNVDEIGMMQTLPIRAGDHSKQPKIIMDDSQLPFTSLVLNLKKS